MNEKQAICLSCKDEMDDYAIKLGVMTCSWCRNEGLTITSYDLEPIDESNS